MHAHSPPLDALGAVARALALASAFLVPSLAPPPCRAADPPPDVLLLTIDTLRADHLGCYGRPGARTPALDRLARRGVQFARCVSSCPLTLPSHSAIMTGRPPLEHGVRNNGTYQLGTDLPVVAEALGRAGRRTGAFVAAFPLAAPCGLERGFDEYDDDLPVRIDGGFDLPERPGGEVVAAAIRWAAEQPAETPAFLWVHLFEPHFPYSAPEPLASLYRDRPYDAEVAQADRLTARLLAGVAAARGRPLAVVAASDHGEGLGDHGEATHGLFVFESTLHVPLIVVDAAADDGAGGAAAAGGSSRRAGGRTRPAVVEEPVGLVDVAPTLLRLAGEDPSPLLNDGNAVLPPWGRDAAARPIYSETLYPLESYGWSPAFALREGSRKVILSARRRGYRLDADPGERSNLREDGAPPWTDAMLDELARRVEAEDGAADATMRAPSPEEIEALAALGYAGGAPAADGGGKALLDAVRDRPDMEDALPAVEATTAAANAVEAGHPEQAIAPLRSVLDRYPESVQTHLVLARALLNSGDRAGALDQYQAADRLEPNDAGVALVVARLHRDEGDRDAALEPYERAVRLVDRYRSWIMEAAECHALAGRPDRARQIVRDALAGNPPPLDAALLGEALRRLEARERALGPAAREPVDRAHPADPSSAVLLARYDQWQSRWDTMLEVLASPAFDGDAEVHLYRGVARHRLGDVAGAFREYTKAVALDDSLHLAHNNRAWILATNGRPQEALASARRAVELLPSEPEYRDTLVEVLERLGRGDEARRELSRALEEFPGNAGLRARAEAASPGS